jgi:acyl dehydratase
MTSVSMRHVLEQGPMLRTLGGTAFSALTRRAVGGAKPIVPSEWISAEVRAPSSELVRAFVKNSGGDPSSYRDQLPPHLFPQWALPVASRVLAGLPYPLTRVLNAGCRIESRAPIPFGERLQVRARLEAIDDDGTRAILTTRIVTGTATVPDALTTDVHAFVPLARRAGAPRADRRATVAVPPEARELTYLRLGTRAGLDFAKLTGDFNPIHWVPAYARAAGFRSIILHGFATFAMAVEAIVRGVLSGRVSALHAVEARFVKPLALPARVGVYVGDVGDSEGALFVGTAPGAAAYLAGKFATDGRSTP